MFEFYDCVRFVVWGIIISGELIQEIVNHKYLDITLTYLSSAVFILCYAVLPDITLGSSGCLR